MKAYLIVSASTPILILSSFPSADSEGLREKLGNMGITKYIAFEAPPEDVRRVYGDRYEKISKAVKPAGDLRVLDYNGFTAFENFSLDRLSIADKYEFSA